MEKINWAHNTDSFILLEPQEIEVARNDEVRFAGKSTGENVVIVRVFWDDVGDGFGYDDFTAFGNGFQANANIPLGPLEPSKYIRHFAHDGWGDDELIRSSLCVLYKLCQGTVGKVESRDVDIRIEHHPKTYWLFFFCVFLHE